MGAPKQGLPHGCLVALDRIARGKSDVETYGNNVTQVLRQRGYLEIFDSNGRETYRLTPAGRAALEESEGGK